MDRDKRLVSRQNYFVHESLPIPKTILILDTPLAKVDCNPQFLFKNQVLCKDLYTELF